MNQYKDLLQFVGLSLLWFFIGWFSKRLYDTQFNQPDPPLDRVIAAAEIMLEEQYRLGGETQDEIADELINSMVALSQDRYATYYRPPASDAYNANFEGREGKTGMGLEPFGDGYQIIDIASGSSAEAAGVQIGDLLQTVNGTAVSELTLGETVFLLTGSAGSTVVVELVRDGETLAFNLERQDLVPEARMLSDQIGYLYLPNFGLSNLDSYVNLTLGLFDSGAEGLILDLRGNQGGSMGATANFLSLFLPEDALLFQAERKDGIVTEMLASNADPYNPDIHLVILTDGKTLSSSEMAAAVLTETGRGTVIGETTGGKGMMQIAEPLSDGYLLQYSFAKWLSPSGQWSHESGVLPAIEVADNPETPEDEPLDRAIDFMQASFGLE